MFTSLPAGSVSGAEGRKRDSASASPRAAAAGRDFVWNTSGSIREGAASQVGLVSCVLAIPKLFFWPHAEANIGSI